MKIEIQTQKTKETTEDKRITDHDEEFKEEEAIA